MRKEGPILEEALKIMWPTYKEDYEKAVQEGAKELVENVDEAVRKAAKKAATEAALKTLADNIMKKFGVSLSKACEDAGISMEAYERAKALEAAPEPGRKRTVSNSIRQSASMKKQD